MPPWRIGLTERPSIVYVLYVGTGAGAGVCRLGGSVDTMLWLVGLCYSFAAPLARTQIASPDYGLAENEERAPASVIHTVKLHGVGWTDLRGGHRTR